MLVTVGLPNSAAFPDSPGHVRGIDIPNIFTEKATHVLCAQMHTGSGAPPPSTFSQLPQNYQIFLSSRHENIVALGAVLLHLSPHPLIFQHNLPSILRCLPGGR